MSINCTYEIDRTLCNTLCVDCCCWRWCGSDLELLGATETATAVVVVALEAVGCIGTSPATIYIYAMCKLVVSDRSYTSSDYHLRSYKLCHTE